MDETYSLLCPFLNDNPDYAHGVELGMLFERMKQEDEIDDYFTMANQDQILLLAGRLKWTVKSIEAWGDQWFRCKMVKETDHDQS